MSGSFITRSMHRVHRPFGTALFVLLALWFASGAVMTVAPFPSFSERERLASELPLPLAEISLPAAVAAATTRGDRVRLANVEGRATWLLGAGAEGLTVFDAARARREIERRFGAVRQLERLDQPDQWSVAQRTWPLFRARLANDDDVYLAARSGEIVQQSTHAERVWAWFGPIPHWVYFTKLRQQRELWRSTVLVLSALGLIVSGSGLIAGVSVARRLRRPIRDASLRWHQRLGLAFGLLASTWLFSGALSLNPFHWSQIHRSTSQLFAAASPPSAHAIERALHGCQRAFEVRELELASLMQHNYAVCLGTEASRIVDLTTMVSRESLPPSVLPRAAWADAPDAYFYPTHGGPDFPPRYFRLALGDAEGSQLYIDPKRARLLMHHTRRTRLERWLYNGMHSLDLPGLYDHPTLWRATIWLAMVVGFLLSVLGGWLGLRRAGRRLRKRRAHAPVRSGVEQRG